MSGNWSRTCNSQNNDQKHLHKLIHWLEWQYSVVFYFPLQILDMEMPPVLFSFWKHSATTSSKKNINEFCSTVKVNYISMTVSHHCPYLSWYLTQILSISLHNTAVFSSKAKRLRPPYPSTKAINVFLFFFSLIICYFIPPLLYTA